VKADSGTPKIFNSNPSKSASKILKILRFYVDFIAIALIYQEKE
jgi:hypothetical protein